MLHLELNLKYRANNADRPSVSRSILELCKARDF